MNCNNCNDCIYRQEVNKFGMNGKTSLNPFCNYKDKYLHELKFEEKTKCFNKKTLKEIRYGV